MNQVDSALGCFEISVASAGYRLLDAALKRAQVTVVEASMLSPFTFMILLQGKVKELRDIEAMIGESMKGPGTEVLIDKEILLNPNPRLLPAMYSLVQQPLENCLLVVETDTVCGALSIANYLLSKDEVKIIDLKISRGVSNHSIMYFTGSSSICRLGEQDVPALLTKAERKGRTELIEDPSEGFRRFFNLDGKV